MPTVKPSHFVIALLYPLCLACQGADTPSETEIGPGGTSGTSTAPGVPTTSPNTPTTTMDNVSTSSGQAPMTTSTGDDGDPTSIGGDDTMMRVPECGNGFVDDNEECDEGLVNNDNLYCTKNCKLNVCGDGKLFVGYELCDEGAANSDDYGSLCATGCVPGARCGDNKLQPEFETCDLGPNNGGIKGDQQEILCDTNCRAQRLRGFVTKDAFTGNLGGPFGADAKCRTAAAAAGLAEPERFYAYLSTGDEDAKTRFEKVATSWPYVLVTGKKFANNFATLIEAGPLGQGISVTEDGATLYGGEVASNTKPGGIRFSDDQHCKGWTSADGLLYKARIGFTAVPADSPDADTWKDQLWWTGFGDRPCTKIRFHLYCLEI